MNLLHLEDSYWHPAPPSLLAPSYMLLLPTTIPATPFACPVVLKHAKILNTYRVVFLTGPPDFQYQNEKQVAANQD